MARLVGRLHQFSWKWLPETAFFEGAQAGGGGLSALILMKGLQSSRQEVCRRSIPRRAKSRSK